MIITELVLSTIKISLNYFVSYTKGAFSTFKCLKSYLRSTMTEKCYNVLILTHINNCIVIIINYTHKDMINSEIKIVNEQIILNNITP